MRTTSLGLDLIKAFESLRLVGYLCPAGIPTVGYGATSATGRNIRVGLRINKQTADLWLAQDVALIEADVVSALGPVNRKLTSHQFDALVSLAYNIGISAFRNSTIVRKIKAEDFEAVPAQIMRWNKVKGVTVTGLTRRRRAEAALWRGDIDDAERYTGMNFATMPQAVDAPKPPKPITASKTGNASIITGVLGGGTLLSDAIDKADTAVSRAETLHGLFERLVALPVFWIALVVIACAAFIWWDRRRKLEEGV